MPAKQRGEPYRLGRGRWGLRFYDETGRRRRRSGFASRTEALDWYETVERPRQLGLAVAAPPPDVTLAAFVEEFLTAKGGTVEPVTVRTLRVRLAYATRQFGTLTLREIEPRPREIAEWAATLGGMRYPVLSALRQALDAAVRWRLLDENPAKAAGPNPQPRAREVTPFAPVDVEMIAAEIGPWAPLVVVAAETGLRPEEWIGLERRDVRRDDAVLLVERVFSDGAVKGYGKTSRSRRRVPLTDRALTALEALPPRLDTRLVFPAARGGHIDLHNWRAREWYPALDAAGLGRCGPYALRHTFVTNALAAGVPIFDVARYAGTSVEMIEKTYGHLARGSEEHARTLLDTYSRRRLGQDWATTDAADESD